MFLIASTLKVFKPKAENQKMRAMFAAFAMVLLVNTPAWTQSVWVGAGTATCSEFAESYREDPTYFETFFYTWAQGFMSGLNLQRLSADNTVKFDKGIQGMEKYTTMLRIYCDAHPLQIYLQAVVDLYNSLAVEQGVPQHPFGNQP